MTSIFQVSLCQPCKLCTSQSSGCTTNRTWQPCGMCRAPRKIKNVDLERRCPPDIKTSKFGTLPNTMTDRKSPCRDLECCPSPTAECPLQVEECPHVNKEELQIEREERSPTRSICYGESDNVEEKWEGVFLFILFYLKMQVM